MCVSVVLACYYRVNINILVGGEGGGGRGHAYDSNKMGGGRAGRSSQPSLSSLSSECWDSRVSRRLRSQNPQSPLDAEMVRTRPHI